MVHAVELVAARLGNTPAICRKCYIHPVVIEGYLEGKTIETVHRPADAGENFSCGNNALSAEETAVLELLQNRIRWKITSGRGISLPAPTPANRPEAGRSAPNRLPSSTPSDNRWDMSHPALMMACLMSPDQNFLDSGAIIR